ncbi:hypothetical protein F6477_01655, partial [Photobacterium damselae subsp. damselae]
WRVASGEWRVASGEWRVASGEWRVASGEILYIFIFMSIHYFSKLAHVKLIIQNIVSNYYFCTLSPEPFPTAV